MKICECGQELAGGYVSHRRGGYHTAKMNEKKWEKRYIPCGKNPHNFSKETREKLQKYGVKIANNYHYTPGNMYRAGYFVSEFMISKRSKKSFDEILAKVQGILAKKKDREIKKAKNSWRGIPREILKMEIKNWHMFPALEKSSTFWVTSPEGKSQKAIYISSGISSENPAYGRHSVYVNDDFGWFRVRGNAENAQTVLDAILPIPREELAKRQWTRQGDVYFFAEEIPINTKFTSVDKYPLGTTRHCISGEYCEYSGIFAKRGAVITAPDHPTLTLQFDAKIMYSRQLD